MGGDIHTLPPYGVITWTETTFIIFRHFRKIAKKATINLLFRPTNAQLLPAFQVQVLIWTGDSGSNPERAHGRKFLVCQ
jgi:hypothetical protein